MGGLSYHILRCTPFSFSGLYLQKIASLKKKKKKGIRTAKDHNRPSGLYSCTDQKEVLTFYLRSNSQWITVAVLRKRLRSAAKQGQQKDTL